MLVSLHNGSTIPMEQSLLVITKITGEHFKTFNHHIKVHQIHSCSQVKVPVSVCEVHPQDDVLLRVLMAVGVDDNHVANPL